MKSVVIGSTVYSNRTSKYSLDSAEVMQVEVIMDLDKVYTWVKLDGGGEQRSITADAFFNNYTDVAPFFRVGRTYRDERTSVARYEITDVLKSEAPVRFKGLYAVAKRYGANGTYSYITLDENDFKFLVEA